MKPHPHWPRLAAAPFAGWLGWAGAAPVSNGYDLADASVAQSAIQRGGPPRDGIPAIDRPHFVGLSERRAPGWLAGTACSAWRRTAWRAPAPCAS